MKHWARHGGPAISRASSLCSELAGSHAEQMKQVQLALQSKPLLSPRLDSPVVAITTLVGLPLTQVDQLPVHSL